MVLDTDSILAVDSMRLEVVLFTHEVDDAPVIEEVADAIQGGLGRVVDRRTRPDHLDRSHVVFESRPVCVASLTIHYAHRSNPEDFAR